MKQKKFEGEWKITCGNRLWPTENVKYRVGKLMQIQASYWLQIIILEASYWKLKMTCKIIKY